MMRAIVFSVIVAMTIAFVPVASDAGGPFVVDYVTNTGVACQWQGNKVIWAYDEGPFNGDYDNATAVEWVRESMDMWMNVKIPDGSGDLIPTVDVVHEDAGGVGGDISTIDYIEYLLTEDYGVGAVIVFDEDGSLMDELGFPSDQVLGLTLPTATDDSGLYITRGIIILNGAIMQYLPEPVVDNFKAALTHEVGHLYNLDHSQVNLEMSLACELGGDCDFDGDGDSDGRFIPNMFPELKSYRQGTSLTYDDRITLSWIYPNTSFKNDFCTITGAVKDKDGKPLQGVNVLARYTVGTTTPLIDVRSMVSGVLYPACTADGHYYLHGLRPGRTYQVEAEPLTSEYTESSGFEPFSGIGTPLPPKGFGTVTITQDGNSTVTCNDPGQVITMDEVQIDVANPCDALTEPGAPPSSGAIGSDTTSDGGGGKCSLTPGASPHTAVASIILLAAMLALLMIVRRRGEKRQQCRS